MGWLLSRKDYQAIAAIIARRIYDLNDAGIWLVSDLADYLESDNPAFDRDRFADACIPDPFDAKMFSLRTVLHGFQVGMRVHVEYENSDGTIEQVNHEDVCVRLDSNGTVVSCAHQQVTPLL